MRPLRTHASDTSCFRLLLRAVLRRLLSMLPAAAPLLPPLWGLLLFYVLSRNIALRCELGRGKYPLLKTRLLQETLTFKLPQNQNR